MYSTLLRSSLLATAVTLSGCAGQTPGAESETALGLTRVLPPEYVQGCIEIQREMHVDPCPPLVPGGSMDLQAWADSLDMMNASVLSSIGGHDVDAHGGHWTLTVTLDARGRKELSDNMHATGAKASSECRFLELHGQRVEACRVPSYADGGGYYGNHIAYEWQRGEVTYDVTLHNHANEPRLQLMMAALIEREMTPRVRPRFEGATIRRCIDGESENVSPGRMTLNCRTVASLAETAYVQYEDGLTHSPWAIGERGTLVTGGPSWIQSDRYSLDATADPASSKPVMLGPMLQMLLEDRFRLKAHYETRDVPVYDLTVAGGGWPSKLPRFNEERCIPRYSAREDAVPQLSAGQRWCSGDVSSGGAVVRLDVEGATIEEFFNVFVSALPFMDRRIKNRTGVPGRFDFHLESMPRRDAFFAALQEQLGLKLEAATGSARFLVIDSAERFTVQR